VNLSASSEPVSQASRNANQSSDGCYHDNQGTQCARHMNQLE